MLDIPRKIIVPIIVFSKTAAKRSRTVTRTNAIPLTKKGTFLIIKPNTSKVRIKPQCERKDFIKTKKSLIAVSAHISITFAKIYIYKKVIV